jgi:hypothetical protein
VVGIDNGLQLLLRSAFILLLSFTQLHNLPF